jgi:hypothetical protein
MARVMIDGIGHANLVRGDCRPNATAPATSRTHFYLSFCIRFIASTFRSRVAHAFGIAQFFVAFRRGELSTSVNDTAEETGFTIAFIIAHSTKELRLFFHAFDNRSRRTSGSSARATRHWWNVESTRNERVSPSRNASDKLDRCRGLGGLFSHLLVFSLSISVSTALT